MVSLWSLSDSKSPQVSKTLFSILADRNKAVDRMVSTRSLVFKSSSPRINSSVTVQRALITIGIIVTIMFHSSSIPWKGLGTYLSSLFQFYFVICQESKVYNTACSLFFLLLLDLIRWFVCISKSQRSFCVSFTRTDSGLCIYHLFVWSNFNFFHDSQWITFPNQ